MDTQSIDQRKLNLDLLRIVCCFLIVLLHFSSSYQTSVPIGNYAFNVMTVYNSLTRVAVPVFIMLSGYFLLNPAKSFNIKTYLLRPARFLLTVYIWSAFYAFQGAIAELIRTGTVTQERLSDSFNRFVQGHYHMWFCFLLAGYYILLPIGRKIAEDTRVLSLFIILWVIFAFLIPCISSWFNLLPLYNYFEKYEMNVLRGYWGYFLLGYLIRSLNLKKPLRFTIYILGALSMATTIYLSIFQSISSNTYKDNWFSPGSPLILLSSFAAFLLFTQIKINPGERGRNIIVTLSGFSFFIYMFHIFILEKMNLAGITTISFNPLLSVPALSLCAFLVSLPIAWIVSKIPFINKIVLYK